MPDQPELRQRLSDALHEHEMLECSWGVEPNDCNCGHGEKIDINDKRWGRGWSDHVADVLLALPGIAIVELPQTGRNWWPVVHGGEPEQVYLAHEPHDGEQIVCISGAGYCYVDEARAVAAALLAAAGVAEEQTNA